MRRTIERLLPFVVLALPVILIILYMVFRAGVIPILISFLSLVLSIAQFFKDKLLPFDLQVDVTEPNFRPSTADFGAKAMILPAIFINRGYSTGVVKDVYVEMLHESGKKINLYPREELDEVKYRSNKERIDIDALGRPFNAFPIPAQGSVSKHLVFLARDEKMNYLQPSSVLKKGKYECKLFVTTDKSKARLLAKIETGYTFEDLIALAM